ncbi:MAG: hypothetical protein ACREFE_03905 [Limisphaerales bacterium]
MKAKRERDLMLKCDSIPPNERRAKFEKMIASGAPPAALTVLIGKIPDMKDPPPLPSLLDMVKRKFGLQIESNAPEWAKLAEQMVFNSLLPQRRKRKTSEEYNDGFDSGYLHGAGELTASSNTMQGCTAILKEHWARLSSEKAADFFCGFRDGEKLMRGMPERAQQMAQRTKIFRAIAAHWKKIAPGVLHSTGELYQWLFSQKVILSGTDSCEIRMVCSKIGLRYKTPGKPSKLKM